MTRINKSDNKCCQRYGELGSLKTVHGEKKNCSQECKIVLSLWKAVWKFLKRLKAEFSYDPAISLSCIYPRGMKTYVHTKTCTQMFIAASFIIDQNWKRSWTGEWINKMWHIHTINQCLSIKRSEAHIHANNTDGSWKHYTKCKEPDTKNNVLCDSVYMKYLNRQICRDRKQISGCLRLGGMGELGQGS